MNNKGTAYYMRGACLQCDRASCGYKTGCIAVRDGKIIARSFNQTLPGEIYCQNGSCYREDHRLSGGQEIEKVCAIHAEANLIAEAARQGMSLAGADIFVSTFPCIICCRSIVQAGFKKVFYMSDYGENQGMPLLKKNNIVVARISEEEVWCDDVKSQSAKL